MSVEAHIREALMRMEAKGHGETQHYRNLLAKWQTVFFEVGGYHIVDVTESTVSAAGSLISKISVATTRRDWAHRGGK